MSFKFSQTSRRMRGNTDLGLSLQEKALSLDSPHPLPLILCAKSLVRSFKRLDLAQVRLSQAATLLRSTWHPMSDDMSREWYEREIYALSHSIQQDEC